MRKTNRSDRLPLLPSFATYRGYTIKVKLDDPYLPPLAQAWLPGAEVAIREDRSFEKLFVWISTPMR
jgi:hypothetical protein